MMALKRPFAGSSMKPLMESILKGSIPPLPSHFSQDLRDLCTSMLEPDPNKRPSIAALFERPYLQKLLNDFEKSASASTLIDADCKALIKANIQEAREMKPDAGNATGTVGAFDATVSYEGPIRKESNRVWKERYFSLKDGDLVIAVKKGDTNTKGISVTTLASVVPVPFHAAKAEGVFALNTLDNKTMWMQAPSKSECQIWIHKIQQAMGIA
jgi:serine/threonine protein kinase